MTKKPPAPPELRTRDAGRSRQQILGGTRLDDVYAGIRQAEEALNLNALPPKASITLLIDFTRQYCLAHPEFIAPINSENLHRAEHQAQSTKIRELNSPLIATLGEVLGRGQAAGAFRSGVDPAQLCMSIAGLTCFYLSNRHTLSVIFGRPAARPTRRRPWPTASRMCARSSWAIS